MLRVHFSGFSSWPEDLLSHRVLENARQTAPIRQAWADSGRVHRYRERADDLTRPGQMSPVSGASRGGAIGDGAERRMCRRAGRRLPWCGATGRPDGGEGVARLSCPTPSLALAVTPDTI